jgi:hypothetical protein
MLFALLDKLSKKNFSLDELADEQLEYVSTKLTPYINLSSDQWQRILTSTPQEIWHRKKPDILYEMLIASCKSGNSHNIASLLNLAERDFANRTVWNNHLADLMQRGDFKILQLAVLNRHNSLVDTLLHTMSKGQYKYFINTDTGKKLLEKHTQNKQNPNTLTSINSVPSELEHPQEDISWKQIAHMSPPHPSIAEQPAYGFKKKLYDELLPAMQLASKSEKNNLAELHAYKLAVLFSNKAEVTRYLDKYEKEWGKYSTQPIHDAIQFSFPQSGKWTIPLWKDKIIKFGPEFSKYLSAAIKLEAALIEDPQTPAHSKTRTLAIKFLPQIIKDKLAKPSNETPIPKKKPFPSSPKEMHTLFSKLYYDRSQENPDFAEIAISIGLSDSTFNIALDTLKTQGKTKDNIPDIIIDGKDIGHPNFYMQRLKPSDPTGFILGKLTNCCQHLNGAGKSCAMHGMTSPNGGFYVWKHREKGGDKIVAQSYVWISKNNALVFDSFEKLGLEYDKLLVPFMEQFVHEIKKKHTVYMGTGGATPYLDYEISTGINCEKPIDYSGYSDAKEKQYLVPPVNRKEFTKWQANVVGRRNNPPKENGVG